MEDQIYQVSTLQALALGYSRKVVEIGELLEHGDTGLGTFEDLHGEMIVVDGNCYRADHEGNVQEVMLNEATPFASVMFMKGKRKFTVENIESIDELKTQLDLKVEEDFGLNSMHVARVDGIFSQVQARSESPYRSHHVELKDILDMNQTAFTFENIKGYLVGLYYPDYMDGINAPGWHFHFLSEDRTKGGHVFDLTIDNGEVKLDKLSRIQLQLPKEAAFDTYALKEASSEDIKKVEQGK